MPHITAPQDLAHGKSPRPTYDVEAYKSVFEHQYLWINGFMRNVLRKRDKDALFCPQTGRSWTYGTLDAEANRLAHALADAGVAQGDVVMYCLLNSAEFVFSYLACHKLRAIGAPMNYRLSAGELALLLDASRPRAFIYDHDFAKVIDEALKLAKHRPPVVVMADLHNEMTPPEGVVAFRDFVNGQPDSDIPLPETASIYEETTRLFTSGTTNLPKAVPINDLNETLSAHDILMHFPLNATDVTMNLTPWFHRGGVHAGGPCPVLYAGGAMVILRDFAPRIAFEYLTRYGVTYLIGVPTVINMVARLQESSPQDLSSLKGIVLMGSPLDAEPCQRYMRLLTPHINNGYGTTETFWNTFLRPYDLPHHAGSAGGPCTDDDVRVLVLKDEGFADPSEMVPMDKKTVGEVAILSPAKSTFCYFENEELTKRKFRDGWLYTGDLATWDEHGYVSIIGRKDDMIVSAGENIYPTQVEAILNEHPKVAESLILGIPDPKRGQVVVAFIKALDPALDEREMKQYCLDHPMLSPYKRPRHWVFLPELPHNATGKLLHRMPEGVSIEDITGRSPK